MATQEQAQTLDETLNKTDFGQVVNENKKPIIVIGILILVGAIAYSFISHNSNANRKDNLAQVYKINTTAFDAYVSGNIDSSILMKKIKEISPELVAHPNLMPNFLAALNKLETEKQISDEYVAIAMDWVNRIPKASFLYLLSALRVSAIAEDAGKRAVAIELLEKAIVKKDGLLQDKVRFELGRMYKESGDDVKAKENFDVLVNEYPNSEFATYAKYYLGGLK